MIEVVARAALNVHMLEPQNTVNIVRALARLGVPDRCVLCMLGSEAARIMEFDPQNPSNAFRAVATLGFRGAAATEALTSAALSNLMRPNPQDVSNTLRAVGTPLAEGQRLTRMLAVRVGQVCLEMTPQNLSNSARTSATAQLAGILLMDGPCQASALKLTESDLQGSANTAWSLSAMLLADSPTFQTLSDLLLISPLLQSPTTSLNHLANEMTHLCQLAWAFSFAGRLSQKLGQNLQGALKGLGSCLDSLHPPSSGEALGSKRQPGASPAIAMRLPGMSVAFKPPYWEVDSKGH